MRQLQNGEGGSRLRPKRDGMTQHGKDFPNRVGNTTTNTTTQRMSLMWSRPTHEGKCPGRFQITDDFRQAQKMQSTSECLALGEFCWCLGPPPGEVI